MRAMDLNITPSQEKIIQAALPLFSQKGYEGVSLSQVAKEAGLSKATILHHFANKDGLYLQSLLYACQQIAPCPLEVAEEFDHLEPFLLSLGQGIEAHLDMAKFITRELDFSHSPHYQSVAEHVFKQVFNQVTTMIESGQKQGLVNQDFSSEFMALTLLMNILKYFQGRHLLPLLVDAPYTTDFQCYLKKLLKFMLKGASA